MVSIAQPAAQVVEVELRLEVKARNFSPGNMEQAPSRGHEASSQIGRGVGCKRCSSRKKLLGLGARALLDNEPGGDDVRTNT